MSARPAVDVDVVRGCEAAQGGAADAEVGGQVDLAHAAGVAADLRHQHGVRLELDLIGKLDSGRVGDPVQRVRRPAQALACFVDAERRHFAHGLGHRLVDLRRRLELCRHARGDHLDLSA